MRKKLLLIAFTFVAFLFVGIVNVNADTEIKSITLDGTSIVPVAGGTPQTLTAPADAPYEIVSQLWINDTAAFDAVTTFTNGSKYVYGLELQPKPGYVFSSDVTVVINGLSWYGLNYTVVVDATSPYYGHYMAEFYYTLGLSSNSVVLDGTSIVPVAGGTPQLLTIPADAPYEIAEQTWTDPITGNPVTTFSADNTYRYTLVLQPKPGHTFNTNDILIVNGISWQKFMGSFTDVAPYTGELVLDGLYRVPAESPNPEDDNPTTPIEDNENPTIPEVDDENQNEDGTPQAGDTINDTENPQTGDNITMSIVLGLISLVGLTSVAVYTKKRFN